MIVTDDVNQTIDGGVVAGFPWPGHVYLSIYTMQTPVAALKTNVRTLSLCTHTRTNSITHTMENRNFGRTKRHTSED